MGVFVHRSAQLGEVVATAYDKAAQYSADPKVVARLVTQAIAFMLRGLGRGRDCHHVVTW